MKLKYIFVIICVAFSKILWAQDPHFTQFYSAPLTVNPAYTGAFDGKIRFMSNYRKQWFSSASPYNTVIVAMDGRLGPTGGNSINLGMMMMNDNSLNGAFKSTYFLGSTSFHLKLDENEEHSIGVGLSATYGNRRVNFNEISFSNQFTSGGFDLTIPSGETALKNMKPYVSIAGGLLYQFHSDNATFDVGISGYHFNKPKQTFTSDNNQFVPIRLSAQVTFQKYIGDPDNPDMLFNVQGIYQDQASLNYFQLGTSLDKLLGPDKKYLVGVGAWYRSADAISPSMRLGINKFMIGFTYDITMSSLKNDLTPANSLEMSMKYILK